MTSDIKGAQLSPTVLRVIDQCAGRSELPLDQFVRSNFNRQYIGNWPNRSELSSCKLLKNMAPQVGLEPTTLRLTAGCSAKLSY